MPEFRIHDSSDLEWSSLRQIVDEGLASTLGEADLDSLMATHEEGSASDPVLHEFKQLAGSKSDAHAHDVPEVIYVLEGTVHIAGRELDTGSSAYIGADTVYTFKVGSGGARFLVFRQRGQYGYWPQASFTELVKAGERAFAEPVATSTRASELEWCRLGDLYSAEFAKDRTAADLDILIGSHEKGENGGIAVDELKMPAGANIPSHAHDVAEHIYVIDGSIKFGNREVTAGSSVYVGPETLYSLTAGDEGAHAIAFVQRGGYKTFMPNDLKAKAALCA